MTMNREKLIEAVSETLINAGSTFSEDRKEAYRRAIAAESNENAKWVLETILQNAEAAEENKGPLCDDTGIPHLVLDVGKDMEIPAGLFPAIQEGVEKGLRGLPGRPMGIMGDDCSRLDQSGGLSTDPAFVAPAPVLVRSIDEDVIRLHIIMQGGGPAIRGRTLRVFHKHSVDTIVDTIVEWASEAVSLLGCSPCTLCIGIGRSQYEATSMMMYAQVDGRYSEQSELEKEITDRVNLSMTGALGLGGDISVLGTFLKVGPQRASGIRVVCLRPSCCFEPRIASVDLIKQDSEEV